MQITHDNTLLIALSLIHISVAESLNNWPADLIAYATQQSVDGKAWPGYKLVAGRSVRRYTSEAEVIKAATEALPSC